MKGRTKSFRAEAAGRKSMMTSAEEADSGEEASGETGKGAAIPAVVEVE